MPQNPILMAGFNTPWVDHAKHTYAQAAALVAPAGALAYITDSTTVTWGANITVGGGTNKVLAWYNGTNWTVVGK